MVPRLRRGRGLPQVGRAGYIQHHRWAYRSADCEAYFLQTDTMAGRYEGGRELDYVVASVHIPNLPVRRLDGASADHWALAVGDMRAGGEPQPLFTSPRHIENMQSGGTLEAEGKLSLDDTRRQVAARRRQCQRL
ncbi:hypothetical protein [Streptomyces blastmyceticus]|uniref:Uncharacterized protein n=1 Tax=Streptomyces blastmyceticus TaxID=68180 RepID=A0ABN0WSW6_9ACTN